MSDKPTVDEALFHAMNVSDPYLETLATEVRELREEAEVSAIKCGTLSKLVVLLTPFVGETGVSEGAVEVLERKLLEGQKAEKRGEEKMRERCAVVAENRSAQLKRVNEFANPLAGMVGHAECKWVAQAIRALKMEGE